MSRRVGPILLARGADTTDIALSAILALRAGIEPPTLFANEQAGAAPAVVLEESGFSVWRYDFSLPLDSNCHYRLGDTVYPVATDLSGDMRIAFVSCNGREHDDLGRSSEERNVMWRRLLAAHRQEPFRLMLHGGDQLYADEFLESHTAIRAWRDGKRSDVEALPFTGEMEAAARADLMRRYLELYSQPEIARVLSRVPSLMIWDDHDIFDGWGSHPAWRLDSPVGRGLFRIARDFFCVFQLGCAPDAPPAICPDRSGSSLGWHVPFPGFSVVAPDLRSERRPDRVMGESGWQAFEAGLAAGRATGRQFVVSSVPALGPRLSLVEHLVPFLPKADQFADDLRDQWQSKAHRREWQRFLSALSEEVAAGLPTTVLSGEIHLATRAEMTVPGRHGQPAGTVHQLVASGITHPVPPPGYALGLGLLARFGEDPLPNQPIRLRPLPGRHRPYTAERNYLILTRRGKNWTAVWDTEKRGRTPQMTI